MNPEIVEKAAFTAVGVRIRTNPKSGEIPQLWSNHGMRLDSVPHIQPDGSFGIMDVVDMEAMIMDYMAAVPVSVVGELPEDMSSWDVPGGTYAVFEATLPTLSQSFDAFYQTWLPNSDYERIPGPEFEHYGPGFNPTDPNSKMSVCVPVKPK